METMVKNCPALGLLLLLFIGFPFGPVSGDTPGNASDSSDEMLRKLDALNRKADETLKAAQEDAERIEQTFGPEIRAREEKIEALVGSLLLRPVEELRTRLSQVDSRVAELRVQTEELAKANPETVSAAQKQEAADLQEEMSGLFLEQEALNRAISKLETQETAAPE